NLLGWIKLLQRSCDRKPVVALHGALFGLRNRNSCDGAVGAAVLSDKSVRIRKYLVAGGSVERSAFRVLDAGIEIQSSPLGSPSIVNAVGTRQRIDIFVIEAKVSGEQPEFRR